MIDIETLRRIARTKGIRNIGFAEKDYFQEIILLAVSREVPHLVFKGGTALYKMHGLDRFSEDVGFSGKITELDIKKISGYLSNFGYENEFSEKKIKSGFLLTFIIDGFLYKGSPITKARIKMDVNDQKILVDTDWPMFFSLYPEIPSYRLKVMALEEIIAEKFRALFVRKKARDAYDIWFLLNKGVNTDAQLIQEKLDLYEIKLGKGPLKEAFVECESNWDKELKSLVTEVPDFEIVRSKIRGSLTSL